MIGFTVKYEYERTEYVGVIIDKYYINNYGRYNIMRSDDDGTVDLPTLVDSVYCTSIISVIKINKG